MEYDKDILRKLQLTQLGILKDIDVFCKKHDIEYFIAYGTAIGAVRHDGFIPWDDDIDICMVRKDYNRFIELAKMESEMNIKYDILNILDTPGYISPFIKVSKKGTLFTEATNTNKRYKQGIFVDILPFDYVPDDKVLRAKMFRKAWIWSRVAILCEIGDPILPVEIKGVKRAVTGFGCKAVHIILKVIRFNKKKAFNRYLKIATKYNSEPGLTLMAEFDDLVPERTVLAEKDIFPTKDIMFEGSMFPGPANMHLHLSNYYGDYMELPPLEMRHNHMAKELVFGDEGC
ncbi:MAG: LicD family protein [Lachnospiraceae bacterium]|nr:LicD family protein [Lachnospiraceae bacterium]